MTSASFSPELLKMYYDRLFPYELMHSWLSYDPTGKNAQIFSHREFSFTLDINGEEIYNRYRSFATAKELQDAIRQDQPHKIDIGAVFSHAPKVKDAVANCYPVERELVFDIDLTDYDPVRKCGCEGASICKKCWTFMTMAVKVMDKGLRDDFGFERIAWFYSGRRGVHAWVCDESARMLTNEARSAVATYFEVSLGSEHLKNSAISYPFHPMIVQAYETLEPMFIESVLPAEGHGLLASPEACSDLLATLPPSASAIVTTLEKKWSSSSSRDLSTPQEKWALLKRHLNVASDCEKVTKKAKTGAAIAASNELKIWPVLTVLMYTYPRLDINVSKMRNHLLKSPFCVHPKTGRVCVPIEVEKVDEFDPFAVPTLAELEEDLNKAGADSNWQQTRLKSYFEPFVKNFLDPMLKELREKERDAADKRDAVACNF